MKQSDVEYLNSLDPLKMYGSLQRIIQDTDLKATPFEKVLKYLVENLIVEKSTLEKENAKYIRLLKENGLYTSENIMEN
jgi:hypothetical protein